MTLHHCTATGMQLLARSVPMARAALQAASPDLRKLGVAQFGRAMQVHIPSSPLCTCGVMRQPCACTPLADLQNAVHLSILQRLICTKRPSTALEPMLVCCGCVAPVAGVSQIAGVQAALEGNAELSRHSQDFANSLIEMLQDPDSGVASDAASALRAAASQSDGAFQPARYYGSTQPCRLASLVPCFSVPAEAHPFGCRLRCTICLGHVPPSS